MNYRLPIVFVLSIWAGLPILVLAQEPDGAWTQRDGANRRSLPSWLKLGVELRGRAESGNAFDSASNETSYLSRVRLNITIQPKPWVRIFVQEQDARVFDPHSGRDLDALQRGLDVHQAYVDFGTAERGWQVRVGRQELALGDERLVGADGYWDSIGQTFDAVRLGYTQPRFRVDGFTGFLVQQVSRRPDPLHTIDRISGLSFQVASRSNTFVEPYLLWKRGGETADLLGWPGHRDVITPGVRVFGELPRSLDFNVEMAFQRGHVVGDAILAWAGHWEAGWKPLGSEVGLRLGLEYNFASGDRDPCDGKHQTFDDLYPAGFNKFGISDPFAWRNIAYPAVGVEVPLTKRWVTYAGYRYFQLASRQDGLYLGGDMFFVRNAEALSADVGSQALVSTAYTHSAHWRLYAGYGYIFPGAYLHQSGYRSPLRTAYVQSSFSF